jgi:hypothetical protein
VFNEENDIRRLLGEGRVPRKYPGTCFQLVAVSTTTSTAVISSAALAIVSAATTLVSALAGATALTLAGFVNDEFPTTHVFVVHFGDSLIGVFDLHERESTGPTCFAVIDDRYRHHIVRCERITYIILRRSEREVSHIQLLSHTGLLERNVKEM